MINRFSLTSLFCLLVVGLASPAPAHAGAQVFPPENRANCNGSLGGTATGRSVLTWDGASDVSCRDLSAGTTAIKTDASGNMRQASSSDITSLVNVSCPTGQVLNGISNGSPVCVSAGSLQQNNCYWAAVPGGGNGVSGVQTQICAVGFYMAGYGNYREGDWTRTGHAQIYCCQGN